ncbi:MAG: TolC family protein [Polyangiales bacterium]
MTVVISCISRVSAAQGLALSLPQALDRSSERAPELVLAERQIREVEARRVGAGILLPVNPRLQVEARPTLSGEAFSEFGYAGILDTQFDLGGAPGARVREAEREAEMARAQRNLDRVSARLRVVAAYMSAQLAELRGAEARAGLELARRVLDAAERRIEAGAGSEFERASAQLELSRIEVSEQAALRERDDQLMQLRDALDIPAEQPLTLTTRVEDPPPLAPVQSYLEMARTNHPELLLSKARMTAIAATQQRLERELFPKLGLYAGVDAAPASPIFGMLGVSGELPIAQRNQGPRAVAARQRETEEARYELQQRRIAREVHAAWDAHERRRAEYTLLSQSSLPAAERSFELADAGWRAGRFDWFRVALAARDLVELRGARIEALAALWTQRIVLARAKGGDVP